MRFIKRAAVLAVMLLTVLTLCVYAQDVDNKDKVAIFSSIDVPEGMTVNGDAVAVFGGVTVKGEITGDVVAIFGNVEVSGAISGDTVAVFGQVSVKDSGSISGDAVGIVGGVEKAPNGVIRGEVADLNVPLNTKKHDGIIPKVSYGDMIGLFLIYAFSCLALQVVPGRIMLMSEESRQQIGKRFGIGFLVSILFIPASLLLSVLLAITLIGIVFIPFIFIAFFLAAFMGMIALEIAIGYRITGTLEGKYATYIYLLVGVVLVYAIKLVPIAGFLAYMAIGIYSIGVAVDTRLGTPLVRRQSPNV